MTPPNGGDAPLQISTGVNTPATAGDYTALKDQFNGVVESNIGRIVALLAATALPVLTAFCAWLQKKIGIDLKPAELVAFIASVGAGIVIMAYKWLANRGDWERAIIDAYKVYLTGQGATTNQLVLTPGTGRSGATTQEGGAS